jgi:hypothetical protein
VKTYWFSSESDWRLASWQQFFSTFFHTVLNEQFTDKDRGLVSLGNLRADPVEISIIALLQGGGARFDSSGSTAPRPKCPTHEK